MTSKPSLPQSNRPTSTASGHWVLARAGKRVLRPGGLKLTKRLLEKLHLSQADVIEFAPGLGRTAQLIVTSGIASYVGVDQDPDALANVQQIVKPYGGTLVNAQAQHTDLPSESASVVVGEAMLTMQGAKGKAAIISEAFRLIKPEGRYAIHELGLTPNNIDPQLADELRKDLANAIRVNARPLTEQEWCALLQEAGFVIEWVGYEPMALLSMRRNFADEGLRGVAKIVTNMVRDKELRQRILQMRSIFSRYHDHLTGIAIVACKPQAGVSHSSENENTN